MPPLFCEHNRVFQVCIVFFQSKPWNQPFFQGDLVHLSGAWNLEAKIWKTEVPFAIGTAAPRPSSRASRAVCMYVCAQLLTSVFISVSIYTGALKILSSPSCLKFQSSIRRPILVFSLGVFVTLFSGNGNSSSHCPLCVYLFA